MGEGDSTKKDAAELSRAGSLETSAVRPSQEPRPSLVVLPEPGAVIGEKYRIDRLIAQGGMGAVYQATHVISGKRVALKWMLPALGLVPGAAERFVREARATARIDHPNVVDIYDVGSDGGSVYLVMEFLRGETLHERVMRAPLSPRGAVALLMPALRGVAAAHAEGVIHRDLKPDNIFLCQSADGELREPKVLDFGISKIAAGDELRDNALTNSGVVMGTPYYMSPEQARGANQVDARSDVYAFGVILYELLTKRRPFEAETYNQLIFKIVTEDPTPIGALNPYVEKQLIAVVERAMARDPGARFQSVEALGTALEAFTGGVSFRPASSVPGEFDVEPSLRAPERKASGSPERRSRPKFALLGAVALALVVAGMLLFRLLAGAPRAERALEPDEHLVKPLTPMPQPATPAAPAAAIRTEPTPLPSGASDAVKKTDETLAPAAPSGAAPKIRAAAPTRAEREPAHAREKAAAPGANALPSDWDEHLHAAPHAPGSAPSAGRLSASDLK